MHFIWFYATNAITNTIITKRMLIVGIVHPTALPIFRCLPDFVKGIPIFLDILFFIPEMPKALFHEKENPYFLPIDYLLTKIM